MPNMVTIPPYNSFQNDIINPMTTINGKNKARINSSDVNLKGFHDSPTINSKTTKITIIENERIIHKNANEAMAVFDSLFFFIYFPIS